MSRVEERWLLAGEGFEDQWELGPVSTSVAHWEAFARVCTYLAATIDVDPLLVIQLAETEPVPTAGSGRGPTCGA